MAKDKKPKEHVIITPIARVAFPHLHKPDSYKGNDPKWSVMLVFDADTDLSAMKKEIKRVMIKTHGTDKDEWPDEWRRPFRDGKVKKKLEGFEPGMQFITISSQFQPECIGPDKEVIGDLEAKDIYAGCYGRASVVCYWYSNSGNQGIGFGLRNFQKCKEGKPIAGGGRPAAEDFDAVEQPDDAAPDLDGDDEFI